MEREFKMEHWELESLPFDDLVYYEAYYHLIWSTASRQPLIDPGRQQWLSRKLDWIAAQHTVEVLATGIMPNHVHMLISIPPDVVPHDFIELLMSESATAYNEQAGITRRLAWQPTYGFMSISTEGVKGMIAYVTDQLDRHARGDLDADLENDGGSCTAELLF